MTLQLASLLFVINILAVILFIVTLWGLRNRRTMNCQHELIDLLQQKLKRQLLINETTDSQDGLVDTEALLQEQLANAIKKNENLEKFKRLYFQLESTVCDERNAMDSKLMEMKKEVDVYPGQTSEVERLQAKVLELQAMLRKAKVEQNKLSSVSVITTPAPELLAKEKEVKNYKENIKKMEKEYEVLFLNHQSLVASQSKGIDADEQRKLDHLQRELALKKEELDEHKKKLSILEENYRLLKDSSDDVSELKEQLRRTRVEYDMIEAQLLEEMNNSK